MNSLLGYYCYCATSCMVRVKAFSENILFFRNTIFWKGKCFHVFGCISKNFPKNIFWCLEKKKEKTNPEKHGQNPEKKSSTIDARRCGLEEGRDCDRRSTGLESAVLREIASDADLAKHHAVEPSWASIAISPLLQSAPSSVNRWWFFF